MKGSPTKPSNGDDTESEPDLERQAMDKYTMHAGRRECRICLSQDDESAWVQVSHWRIGIEETAREGVQNLTPRYRLRQPCQCSGSLSWTHLECLRRWVKESHHLQCEICLSGFQPELVEGISTEPAMGPGRYDVDSEAQRPDPNASSSRNWTPVIVTVGILAVLIGGYWSRPTCARSSLFALTSRLSHSRHAPRASLVPRSSFLVPRSSFARRLRRRRSEHR